MPKRIICLVLGVVALTACSHRYYAIEYKFYRKDVLPPSEVGKFRAAELDVLARAKVVAFAPASKCQDIVAWADQSVAQKDFLSTDCGALMSELESSAQAAGFTVIAWKSLREPAQLHAKEAGVDLLIEVNRLAIHVMKKSEFIVGNVQFFEDYADTSRRKLEVNNGDELFGPRCKRKAAELDRREELAAILDVKVIDARVGNVLTRQIHMWPSQALTVDVVTQFYYGYKHESPEKVLCEADPVEPDWHEKPSLKKPENSPAKPVSGFTFALEDGVSEANLVPHLLQRTAQEFIGTLITIREVYSPKGNAYAAGSIGSKDKSSSSSTTKLSVGGRQRDLGTFRVNELDEARALMSQSRASEAIDKLRDLASRGGTATYPVVYFDLGMALIRDNKCKDAVPELKKFLSVKDKTGIPPAYMGIAEKNVKSCEG